MQIRWTAREGLKEGLVVEVEDSVAQAYIAAGRATPLEMAGAIADLQETPERAKRRAGTAPTVVLQPDPETR